MTNLTSDLCLDRRHLRCYRCACPCHGPQERAFIKRRPKTQPPRQRAHKPKPSTATIEFARAETKRGTKPGIYVPAPMVRAIVAALREGQAVASIARHSGHDRKTVMKIRASVT